MLLDQVGRLVFLFHFCVARDASFRILEFLFKRANLFHLSGNFEFIQASAIDFYGVTDTYAISEFIFSLLLPCHTPVMLGRFVRKVHFRLIRHLELAIVSIFIFDKLILLGWVLVE